MSKYTLTLYKLFSTGIASMLEMVVSYKQMLDAGCLMLDIQECTNSDIEKQPASSYQDPGSVHTGNGIYSVIFYATIGYSLVSSFIARMKTMIAKNRKLKKRMEKLKEEINMSQEQD